MSERGLRDIIPLNLHVCRWHLCAQWCVQPTADNDSAAPDTERKQLKRFSSHLFEGVKEKTHPPGACEELPVALSSAAAALRGL